MNSIFISVIICNYNYGRFIAEAIESVLNQTYTNFELIIVDDGSTDNSREVINSYTDARIQTIFQENGGQAAAFNAGFNKANGELVSFLDSDDIWVSEKLTKVVDVFKYGDYSIVQHNLKLIDTNSQLLGKLWPGLRKNVPDVLRAYISENHTNFFSSTSGIICPKLKLDKIFPIDQNWRICADVLITRPMPMFGKVYNLRECLGYYRIHGSNSWMNTAAQGNQIENNQKYLTKICTGIIW